MSNLMFLLKKKLEAGLKDVLTGSVMVRIDERNDELFICVKADGVDEFAMVVDHLSELLLRGKSVDSLISEIKYSYWSEMSTKLKKKMFKK